MILELKNLLQISIAYEMKGFAKCLMFMLVQLHAFGDIMDINDLMDVSQKQMYTQFNIVINVHVHT